MIKNVSATAPCEWLNESPTIENCIIKNPTSDLIISCRF